MSFPVTFTSLPINSLGSKCDKVWGNPSINIDAVNPCPCMKYGCFGFVRLHQTNIASNEELLRFASDGFPSFYKCLVINKLKMNTFFPLHHYSAFSHIKVRKDECISSKNIGEVDTQASIAQHVDFVCQCVSVLIIYSFLSRCS